MRVVLVEPHQINMPGFELRTFQCVGCGDVEKRPVFDSERARHIAVPVPALAPETVGAPAASSGPAEGTPPGGRKKSLFGGFAKLQQIAADSSR
jgi:hypothetical protein